MEQILRNLQKPSLLARIAIGKAVGLAVGIIGMLVAPLFFPDVDLMTRIGILLWYPTMGALIGVFGVMNYHPVLHMPMPWWVRAPLVGAWMNFVLVFFAYDTLAVMFEVAMGSPWSPFWFVLEGAIVGAIIGFFATRFGGEGAELLKQPLEEAG